MEHYISAYSIKVRNPNADGGQQLFSLNHIGSGDLFDIVKDALTQQKLSSFQHADKVSFKIDYVSQDNSNRAIYGHASYGKFGHSSTLVNVTDDSTAHDRTTDQAETMRHFFYIHLPEEHQYGILLTHRISNTGIYTRLKEELISYFQSQTSGFPIIFSLLRSRKTICDLSQINSVKRIQVKGTKIPDNYMDSLTEQGFLVGQTENDYEVDVVIKPKRSGLLNIRPNFFNTQEDSSSDTIQQEDESTEIETTEESTFDIQGRIQLEVAISNGKKRMISVNDPSSLEMYYNITDEVTLRDGHPVDGDITEYCKILAQDLSADINRI